MNRTQEQINKLDSKFDPVLDKPEALSTPSSDHQELEKQVQSMQLLLFRSSAEEFESIDRHLPIMRKRVTQDAKDPELEQSPEPLRVTPISREAIVDSKADLFTIFDELLADKASQTDDTTNKLMLTR
jgi:hypothetical protein